MIAVFGVLSIPVFAVGIVMLFVQMIRRKPKKKAVIVIITAFIVFVACIVVTCLGPANESEGAGESKPEEVQPIVPEAPEREEVQPEVPDNSGTMEPIESPETVEPVREEIQEEPGESRENPIVITVAAFVNEINTDIEAAAEKYNGKWIKITGTVTDYSRYNGDTLSGYYLYGNYGEAGLRIVCWQNTGAVKQFEKIGDTCTCTGNVREISFSVTEIGDCTIVFE